MHTIYLAIAGVTVAMNAAVAVADWFRAPFVLAASTGLVLFFVGAMIFHAQARVFHNIAFPGCYLLAAGATLCLAMTEIG